jgi:ZIP family zinc transporter
MPVWVQALLWGTAAGAALVLGAALSWRWKLPPKLVSSIMSFGAGVLISALAFELVDEAVQGGGLWPTAVGFLAGAVVYVGANMLLARAGAKHRKRSGTSSPPRPMTPAAALP